MTAGTHTQTHTHWESLSLAVLHPVLFLIQDTQQGALLLLWRRLNMGHMGKSLPARSLSLHRAQWRIMTLGRKRKREMCCQADTGHTMLSVDWAKKHSSLYDDCMAYFSLETYITAIVSSVCSDVSPYGAQGLLHSVAGFFPQKRRYKEWRET